MRRPAKPSSPAVVALAILAVVSACSKRAPDAGASSVSARPPRVSQALQAELDAVWAEWLEALDRGDPTKLDAARAPGARCHIPLEDPPARHREAARLREMSLRCELPKIQTADGGDAYEEEGAANSIACILGEVTPSVRFIQFLRARFPNAPPRWKLDAVCGGK